MKNKLLKFLLGFIVCLAHHNSVAGQGTKADYARYQAQSRLNESLVYRRNVNAHWLMNSGAMWYRVETGPRQFEFCLVKLAQGERSLAFDHSKLATLMSEKLNEKIRSEYLPFNEITLDKDLKHVFIRHRGKFYRFPRDVSEFKEIEASEMPSGNDGFLQQIKASGPSEREIHIQVTNDRGGSILLYWVNQRGRAVRFQQIKAGESHRQHTYAGHVWLVRSAGGKDLAVFEASQDGQVFSIDKQTRVVRPASVRGSLPRNRGRRDTASETSPDGKFRASIRNNNIQLFDIEKKKEIKVTVDGSATKIYRSRFYWSPNSKYFVSFEETPGENRQIHMVESSPRGGGQPRLHKMGYVKPGDKIRTSKPVLVNVATGKRVKVADDLFKTPWRIDQVGWFENSEEFMFRYNQRGHQVMRVVGVDINGQTRAIINEESKTFIDYTRKAFVEYLDEKGEAIWQSERDGWSHLYLYDLKAGKVKNQITKGNWVMRRVRWVDKANRQIWFEASGVYSEQDPYYIHIGRVDFDGSNLVFLTRGDGTHSVQFSPDRKYLVDTYSRVDMAPKSELRSAVDGKLICKLERGVDRRLVEAGWRAPERFVAKGRDGKTEIHGVIYRPSNFDPSKKYPVVEYIYAGPHGSFVPKRFQPSRREKSLTELGFIVVQMDGMGTSNRSKAFHDVCWKNLGDSGFPDRILWIKAAAKQYPEMDLSKGVGIYGGSAGGQSAMRALLAFGDFYSVAVSDCGCHDNRMDKIWWNEQWMGWPIGPHYAEQSNVTNAHKLKGKLFLIVGELDRNVDPASTMQVVNALVKADKDFDFLVVPGAGHGAGSRRYGWRRTQDFLVRHVLGVEPRSK